MALPRVYTHPSTVFLHSKKDCTFLKKRMEDLFPSIPSDKDSITIHSLDEFNLATRTMCPQCTLLTDECFSFWQDYFHRKMLAHSTFMSQFKKKKVEQTRGQKWIKKWRQKKKK